MKKILFLCFCFLLPGQIFAAGFTPDTIWLSNENPIHGDVVDIYVTVFNSGDSNLSGVVRYYDDELLLGEVSVAIAKNSAKLVSLSFEAVQGDRVIFARFSDGVTSPEETKKIRLRVKKPIIPETTTATTTDNTNQDFKDVVTETGEKAGDLAAEGFSFTEEKRGGVSEWLGDQKELAQENKEEFLAGANDTTDTEFIFGAKKTLHSLLIFALTILLFVASTKILFYIVILLLVYGLFKLINSRRDSYDYDD